MKKDGLKRWIKQPETAGKRPNPWVIWVLVGAIAILALSGLFDGKKQKNTQTATEETGGAQEMEAYVCQTEERLSQILEKINGAGKVSVFISVENGGEKILATDQSRKSSSEAAADTEQSSEEQEQNVVLAGQSAGQSPYILGEKLPVPSGVLVVAEGASDEKVRLAMYEAVRAVFGLSAHRVKITD